MKCMADLCAIHCIHERMKYTNLYTKYLIRDNMKMRLVRPLTKFVAVIVVSMTS